MLLPLSFRAKVATGMSGDVGCVPATIQHGRPRVKAARRIAGGERYEYISKNISRMYICIHICIHMYTYMYIYINIYTNVNVEM